MRPGKSDFPKAFAELTVEGIIPERLLNSCMSAGIIIRNVRNVNDACIKFSVLNRDISKVEELAGNRYKVRVTGYRGFLRRLKWLSGKRPLTAGLILFACLMIYQSLFISEIKINGYESINEMDLRKTLEEAGFYEGCRKNVDITDVKLHVYDTYENVTWVGIRYNGNLATVTIAESGHPYKEGSVDSKTPCNIVAGKDGYIERVIPKEGVRALEDGAFVKEGTVIISGKVPLDETSYAYQEDKDGYVYVHAAGEVQARIPVHLDFYCDRYITEFDTEGKFFWSFAVNGRDMMSKAAPFETSTVSYKTIINSVKPFRLKIDLVKTEKVSVKRTEIKEKDVREMVLNEIRKYVKENLPDNTQILNKSLNFTQEKNIINISVTLETLQQIGIEEEIIIDKSNGKSEKDDDQ